ncbi:DUF3795 domain-containing protein [uncultured Methanospirillum sp.]|uniref:DUF3795 domain-containing protein n=1 Tax=uncultured Methanospirillum sp. TaxID=262503 RepID=UPI0029C6A172|nr:DUF3795 domain-containing protein [uncultured Methanospirillum sp.]
MEEQNQHGCQVEKSEDIRACCGFHCSQCPAYVGNIRSEADQSRVSEAWKKIYGLEIPAEAIRCDGCQKPDNENPHRIGGACEMKTCVQKKKISHCGYCEEFPCSLIERHLGSVESVAPGCVSTLTPDEFKDFIEPYLCREYLKTGTNQ